ncbi:MAG: lytic murein transglycosylase [Candidatus Paceibacterota bacterium]
MVKKIAIVFIFVLLLTFGTPKASLSFDCEKDLNSSSSASQRRSCQNELDKLLQEQADLEAKLKEQNKQTGTLKGDVIALTTQINALKTKVKARALIIAELKVDINDKVSKIETLSGKIEREHVSLAQLLRNTNDFDNQDFIYLIFSDESLSTFYSDLESYASIKQAIKMSVDQIRGIKTETEIEKKGLEKKQNAETDAKAELESAQKKVVQSEAEKKKLLVISTQTASAYQLLAADRKARAAKIRSALFNLAGISQKIEFGTALEYANEAKNKTGIDPAFLLAILTQESNLGANVGQCYLTNVDTGEGAGKNTGTYFKNVMKPTRDVGPFLEITNNLGFDAFKTAVSCPIAGVAGWGGAMGPAQFIPSTWKLFENRLKNLLGYFASPWAPKDSFMASSLYLTDLGAVGTSASAQNRAACKYYGSGGATCSYSNSVMKLKSTIQDNIDLLSS